MGQASRDIKRRIRSIKNTNKITKAMELVSAAKMRKAVAKVLASRSYSDLSWETVLRLVKKIDAEQHLFFQQVMPVKKVLVILISTNRGLCGSFNAQLAQKLIDSIKLHHPEAQDTDVITFGVKGREEVSRYTLNLVADFAKEDITENLRSIFPLARLVTKEWQSKKYQKVFVAYTDFMSPLKQVPHIKQLLPIVQEIDERLGHINHEKKEEVDKVDTSRMSDFVFEPGKVEVLDYFLPRLLEMQIYQAVLESEASEHSARMFAMRNASEAAEEMLQELTLAYNQARQAGITSELAEISAGTAALN